MEEKQFHINAFEFYFRRKQTGDNTHKAILATMKYAEKAEKTIYKWKKEFDWDTREKQRAKEVNEELIKKNNEEIIENKLKYLTFGQKLLEDLRKQWMEEQGEDGKGELETARIKSVDDLKKIITMCVMLQGEPTEITQNHNNHQHDFGEIGLNKEIMEKVLSKDKNDS